MSAIQEHDLNDFGFDPNDKPAGYREYEARCAIREIIKIYGEGGARQLVNEYLADEARRMKQ